MYEFCFVFCLHKCMCIMCLCVSAEARRGRLIPWISLWSLDINLFVYHFLFPISLQSDLLPRQPYEHMNWKWKTLQTPCIPCPSESCTVLLGLVGMLLSWFSCLLLFLPVFPSLHSEHNKNSFFCHCVYLNKHFCIPIK